jgi:hypothetical protein
MMEYNPQPPFRSGHPDVAERSIVATAREKRAEAQQNRLREIDEFISRNNS